MTPRLLFLDAAVSYVNPTRNLLPRLAALAGEASFFGPGYASSDVLRRGLATFVAENGPFDVAIATEHIAFSRVLGDPRTLELYRRNYRRFTFPHTDLEQRGRILDDLSGAAPLTIAMLLESDFYDFTPAQVEQIDQRFHLVASWGPQFFRPLRDLAGVKAEPFAARATDVWFNFVEANAERMIPLLHFVGDDEFCFAPLSQRARAWCVPGSAYSARRRALAALARTGIGARRRFPIAGALSRLGLRPLSWEWFVVHYQQSFRRDLRNAKYAFTCGSALRFPIRKFFEIPAMGTVLTCEPCNGFEAMGFRDGVNAFVCPPETLPDLHRRLVANPDYAQQVASAGRDLVGRRHTLGARAEQLKLALRRAVAGEWRGAAWTSGEIIPASCGADSPIACP
jgi:hypothetical protein